MQPTPADADRPVNPFGSRFTRPGALPFLWSDLQLLSQTSGDAEQQATQATQEAQDIIDQRLNRLVQSLLATARGSIIGPHGSGKSTLLTHLLDRLRAVDPTVVIHAVTLHAGEPATELKAILQQADATAGASTLLVIDGFEQLPWWGRWQLLRRVQRLQWRLLITAHHNIRGFTTLFTTIPEPEIASQLFALLLADFPEIGRKMEGEFMPAWTKSGGDFRQLWSAMYDRFEELWKQDRNGEK